MENVVLGAVVAGMIGLFFELAKVFMTQSGNPDLQLFAAMTLILIVAVGIAKHAIRKEKDRAQ